MAKVIFSEFVDGVRGSIGGLIWSANGSGPYVKRRGAQTKSLTLPQVNQRAAYGSMAALWLSITSGQRTDWNDYAALSAQQQTDSLGNTYYLSGFQWFAKCNLAKQRYSSTVQEDAPTIAVPTTSAITGVYFEEGALRWYGGLTTDDATLGTNLIVLRLCPVWNTERTSQSHGFRVFVPDRDDTGATSYWDVDIDEYQAVWGEPYVGIRLFITAWVQTTEGRRSSLYSSFADYTIL